MLKLDDKDFSSLIFGIIILSVIVFVGIFAMIPPIEKSSVNIDINNTTNITSIVNLTEEEKLQSGILTNLNAGIFYMRNDIPQWIQN